MKRYLHRILPLLLAALIAVAAASLTSCHSTRAYWGVEGQYNGDGSVPPPPPPGHQKIKKPKKPKKPKKHKKHHHHHHDAYEASTDQ